ncbi:hypothetical protein TRVA0_002S00892 [Trichomonascus vanleenenianus]|uniref:Tda2p n=1 Tax=Trichomonascus vanleenenianus TaxID=2268995 RepID=UPI003ECA8897
MSVNVQDSGSLGSNSPLSPDELQDICKNACGDLLDSEYDHEKSSEWNSRVINSILGKLREATKSYKFVTYVTLVDKSSAGPNGIRTSTGSYWNSEKDGVWNFKIQGSKIDAIVSIVWVYSG